MKRCVQLTKYRDYDISIIRSRHGFICWVSKPASVEATVYRSRSPFGSLRESEQQAICLIDGIHAGFPNSTAFGIEREGVSTLDPMISELCNLPVSRDRRSWTTILTRSRFFAWAFGGRTWP